MKRGLSLFVLLQVLVLFHGMNVWALDPIRVPGTAPAPATTIKALPLKPAVTTQPATDVNSISVPAGGNPLRIPFRSSNLNLVRSSEVVKKVNDTYVTVRPEEVSVKPLPSTSQCTIPNCINIEFAAGKGAVGTYVVRLKDVNKNVVASVNVRVTAPVASSRVPLNTPLTIPYPVVSEAISSDGRTLWVVSNGKVGNYSGQTLERFDLTGNQSTGRIDLGVYSHQVSTQVSKPVIHPVTGKLYLALDQVNSVGSSPDIPQYRLMLLEVASQNLPHAVTRVLAFNAFEVRTPSGNMTKQPEKVHGLSLSPTGDGAYTWGNYSKIGDSGTVGSVGWVDLIQYKHNGIKHIQDIVSNSGVRAAAAAAGWTYMNITSPPWTPGGNRVLLGSDQILGVLEATLSPSGGMTPVQTLSNMSTYTPVAWIGDTLILTRMGGIFSLNKNNLRSNPTFLRQTPSIEWVENGNTRRAEFTFGSVCVSQAQNKIFLGGRDGMYAFDLSNNSGKLYDDMIVRQFPSRRIESIVSCDTPNSAVLHIRELSGGGIPDVKDEYRNFAY